ncbi:hypothetical protein NEOLI_001767 [Neolecta irregularis DAH-3]|uniref:Uncharacterized protein n=1 Tax=Neolecta irregularis (strain DAH-3) TaxID=1198029 RepID=A0A1U7LID3_NEOID|nr:hypothetical protein NEOLI_001767 [Neolecta irregularis DAH-3]|eukprot:OLL22420.1 hypothetical protein NEOLI_001767 [Neolecta irregularis DAH-3]
MQQRTLRSTAAASTSPTKKRKRDPETNIAAPLIPYLFAALSSKPDYGVLDQPIDNATIRYKLKTIQIPSVDEFWRFAKSVLASTSRTKGIIEGESDEPDDIAPPARPYERQALYIQANGQPLFTSLSNKPVIDPILSTTSLAQPLNVIPLPYTPAPTIGAISPGDNDIGRQMKRVFPEDTRVPHYPGLYYGNFASFAPTRDSNEQVPENDAYIESVPFPELDLDELDLKNLLENFQDEIDVDHKLKERFDCTDELGSICPENINCMLRLLQEMQSTRLRISQHSPISEQEQSLGITSSSFSNILANQIRDYLTSRILSLKPSDFGRVKKTILTEGKSYQGSLPPIQVPIAAPPPVATPTMKAPSEDRSRAGTPIGRRTLPRSRK